MRRKRILLLLLVGALLLGSAGAALAIGSINYEMPKNTNEGGGAGGSEAASENYILLSSFGGAVQVSSTSASYQFCSGFLCAGDEFFRRLFDSYLPYVNR